MAAGLQWEDFFGEKIRSRPEGERPGQNAVMEGSIQGGLTKMKDEKQDPYVIRTSNQNEKAELLRLECTNCGASLELMDRTHARCPYCGQKYLIDEAKGTIIHVQVDYSGSDEMYEAVSSTKKVLIVFLIVASVIAMIIFGFNVAAKKSVFSRSDENIPVDANGELLVIFCKDIFGKEYKEITEEEFASIRYLRCSYEREGAENYNMISYSFVNYEDCQSEEEFQETVKKWTYRTKRVSWPSDYTMFTGLTRIDTTDAVWLSLRKFSPDSRITYIDTDDSLDTISQVLNPENIKVMHIGIMGTDLKGIGQYKNLEELDVDTNLTARSVDINGIEQCKNLKRLRLRCGEAYEGLENIGSLACLKSLYIDQVPIEECTFLRNLPQLEELSVYTGEEAGLSVLDDLPNLKKVDFLDMNYIPPGEIHRLQGVEELSIAVNETEGVNEIASLSSLKALELHMAIHEYNAPVDISVLGTAQGLQRLWLDNFWGGEITGAEQILRLPELSVLWIGRKGTSDVELLLDAEGLEDNPSVQELGFWACFPENAADKEKLDFSFLLHYPNVKRLYLEDCGLEDISFLSEMEDLRACSLQENEISSLSPLLECKKLEIVAADQKSAAGVRFPSDVVVNLEPFARIYE